MNGKEISEAISFHKCNFSQIFIQMWKAAPILTFKKKQLWKKMHKKTLKIFGFSPADIIILLKIPIAILSSLMKKTNKIP